MELAESAVRAHEVCTGARFQKAFYRAAREPRASAEVDHAVTVEPCQSFRCAEPHEPAGIGDDAVDMVGCQAVRRRVGPDRQQFGDETQRYGYGRHWNCPPSHVASLHRRGLHL